MASELQIYPSGFLGPKHLRQSTPADPADVARQLMDRNRAVEIQRHTYSLEAEDYMQQLLNGNQAKDQFTQREEVLSFAKSALDARASDVTVATWVTTQFASPEFSDYHRRWLEETFEFIYWNKRRDFMINTWVSLLTVKSSVIYKGAGPSQKLRDMFGSTSITMNELILMWISKDGGYNDLVQSLYVLYGPRRA
jgi:hypothetical protein